MADVGCRSFSFHATPKTLSSTWCWSLTDVSCSNTRKSSRFQVKVDFTCRCSWVDLPPSDLHGYDHHDGRDDWARRSRGDELVGEDEEEGSGLTWSRSCT